MLIKKDVCIIIPTYNRPKDLEVTIKAIINRGNMPGKIVVLDQSKNDESKKMLSKYINENKFIQYRHFKVAGTNLSLNAGIDIVKKEKFKILCIMADDVEVLEGFLDKILREFNEHKEVMGVGSVQIGESFNYSTLKFKLKKIFLNFFLLPSEEDHKFRVSGPYGNTTTPDVKRDVRDCQWLPGFTTSHRIEIFDNYRIPDRIGYDVIEDIDIGYYTYRMYGKGSLVIPKDLRVYHHYSKVERYADRKRIFVNHEDHFAFYYRHFYNLTGTLKFIWEIFWIAILNIIRAFTRPKKDNFLKVVYLWQALSYCIKYREEIKRGKSRMFLNPDLSMNKEF